MKLIGSHNETVTLQLGREEFHTMRAAIRHAILALRGLPTRLQKDNRICRTPTTKGPTRFCSRKASRTTKRGKAC
jgi:hypothetical protein